MDAKRRSVNRPSESKNGRSSLTCRFVAYFFVALVGADAHGGLRIDETEAVRGGITLTHTVIDCAVEGGASGGGAAEGHAISRYGPIREQQFPTEKVGHDKRG